jgi:iron(III) transport system permease protein
MRAVAPLWQRARPGSLLIVVIPVLLLVVLPVGRLVTAGLSRGGEWAPAAVADIITTRSALLATIRSLESSLASALVATLVGAVCALAITLWRLPGSRAFAFLFVLSMMMAPQVIAVAFIGMLGPSSPLLLTLGLAPEPGTPNPMRSAGGIVALLALHHAPLAFVVVRAGLLRVPRDVVEAALIDGATRLQTMSRVILPLLRSHLAAAALLCFAAALGNFGIPAVLGLSSGYLTLPTLIYRRLSSFGPSVIGDVASLSLILLALASASVVLARRVARRSAGTSGDGRTVDALWSGGAGTAPVAVLMWALVGVGLVLPLASLLASSLVPSYGMALTLSNATLDHFVEVLARQDSTVRAFRNSLLFSATAALVCTALALGIAYALSRDMHRLRGAVETLFELPYVLPGVVLALAAILLLLKPLPLVGVSLYGTGAIIVLAYVSRFLPLSLKPVSASLDQFDRSIEEAAALCGAGRLQSLRYVVLPAVAPGAAAGALMVFLIAFNELTVSALLWSRGTETVGVVLFSLEEAGLASTAAAVGIASTVVVGAVMGVLHLLGRRLPEGSLPWS